MSGDDFEWALRAALDHRARTFDAAPDALAVIRSRTRRRERVHKGGFMLKLATGTGALAASVVFAFAGSTGGCESSPKIATPPAHPSPSAIVSSVAPSPAVSSPGTGGATANVPVYYVGQGNRLFREYHQKRLSGSTTTAQLTAAVEEAVTSSAYDPDYRTGWPAGTSVRSVTVSGGVATVDLHGATSGGGNAAADKAAIQQLVWTATAYSGGTGVRLLFDGAPRTTLWASKQPVSGVLHRAAAVDTLAQLWIIDPQQGAVTGSPVTINVAGIAFEAMMIVEIHDASGNVVFHQGVHLSTGAPSQGSATLTTTLPAGTYTINALISGFKGVTDGVVDGHVFTVR
jgi:hypothetical protein